MALPDGTQTYPTLSTSPASYFGQQIAASPNAIDPRPKSLYVSAAGNITIENKDGTSVTINVFAGGEIHVQPYKVTAVAGGAKVFGMFDL